MHIIHGLIFGKQDLLVRGMSKKLYEHERDNRNFTQLAEAREKFDNIMVKHLCII
jgi:hypothetical protein